MRKPFVLAMNAERFVSLTSQKNVANAIMTARIYSSQKRAFRLCSNNDVTAICTRRYRRSRLARTAFSRIKFRFGSKRGSKFSSFNNTLMRIFAETGVKMSIGGNFWNEVFDVDFLQNFDRFRNSRFDGL